MADDLTTTDAATETTEDGGEREQWSGALMKLGDLTRPGASLPQLSKQEMGLLHKMMMGGSQNPGQSLGLDFLRTGFFETDEEALDFAAAFIEAKDIGFSTELHQAVFNAKCSVNRRGMWANLMGLLTDTLQHAKFAGGQQQPNGRHYGSNSSPLK